MPSIIQTILEHHIMMIDPFEDNSGVSTSSKGSRHMNGL